MITNIEEEWDLDATEDDADWTKQSWDLPPYLSTEFLQIVTPDMLDNFRNSVTYRSAVERGLIYDDEWVGDSVVDPMIAYANELVDLIMKPVKKADDSLGGILPDWVREENPEEEAEDLVAIQLADKAIKLVPVDDDNGQRISGRAHSASMNAYTDNFEDTTDRVANHQRACDMHRIAAKHYETDMPNAACAAAHEAAADEHQKIINHAVGYDATNSSKVSKLAIDTDAHEAAPHEASEAQLHAGNYKMGHINVGGIDISIENPVGTSRKPGWATLKAHYGYIRRTEGADGDHTDCFVRPGTDDKYAGPVYVIDQYIDGKFDEHKCMIGWESQQEAVSAYLRSYQAGWMCGPVTRLTWLEFKAWVAEKYHDEPLSSKNDS